MDTITPSHRCRHCTREFARAEHLVRHERIHTKEKPFNCRLCEQAFSRSDLLRRHEKRAHNHHSPRVRRGEGDLRLHGDGSPLGISIGQPCDATTTEQMDVSFGWSDYVSTSQQMTAFWQLGDPDRSLDLQDLVLPGDYDQLLNFDPDPVPLEIQQNHLSLQVAGPSLLSRPGSPPILEVPTDGAHSPDSHWFLGDRHRITEERWLSMQTDVSQAGVYKLPSHPTLSQFIRRYFGSFHRHQPFLHPPTWSPSTAKTALILAVCANGAVYSLEPDIAVELHKAAVACMQRDEKKGLWTLQTLMLVAAFAAWSGSSDDLAFALQCYGEMTMAVRREWSQMQEEQEGFSCWERWLERECLKRITFCVFTLMNLITVAYDIPASVQLEGRFGIPCTESQWDAKSEEEWIHLQQNSPTIEWQSAAAVMDQLLNEALPVPQQVSIFGCHVVISSLVQRIILFRKAGLSSKGPLYVAEEQRILRGLRRWQLMWESAPRAALSPNSPYGPMLFNSTALLRLAYVRLVADYSCIRSQFSWGNTTPAIEKTLRSMELPLQNHQSARAALHACLALKIPATLGFKLVARTSFWVWSVQHAICYFECALLLTKWLERMALEPTGLSDEELGVIDLVQQVTSWPHSGRSAENLRAMAVAVLRTWGQLLDTKNTTVWGLIPKLAHLLNLHADNLHRA
ncbi:hypothetical protein EYZ11_012335 [Aspergillus tanneri]|uniref:C2H2-type domain-containing protein n=1 Tax=Aspergillus tanneri TaxID=1220188 RepID=A0A4S3J0I2_9EURO|nr:hypothetical protein EYZ11_012335 [Aspergillus tanneri]